jgi:hypothetical protein
LDCKKYQISIKSTRLFNVLVELPAILRGLRRVEEKVQIGWRCCLVDSGSGEVYLSFGEWQFGLYKMVHLRQFNSHLYRC